MPSSFQPDSTRLSVSSPSNWLPYVQTLRDYINNTSSKFGVDQTDDDTSNSGDYGFTASPSDLGESWQFALYYQASDNKVYGTIDPNASISNSLDPGPSGTGSTAAAPISTSLFETYTSLSPHNEFLVSELADTILVMFKTGANDDILRLFAFGRQFIPYYANDDDNGFDGLVVGGGSPTAKEVDATHTALFGIGQDRTIARVTSDSWATIGASDPSFDEEPVYTLPDGRFRPWPVPLKVEESGDAQGAGFSKYLIRWESGITPLTRVEDEFGGGLLIADDAGGGGTERVGFPWDPTVTP